MPEPRDPAAPDDMTNVSDAAAADAEQEETGDGEGPEPQVFTVTFTGPPTRNTMRLEGEGELIFEDGEVTVEGDQHPAGAAPRHIRFMFTLPEIARVGLHEGAVVLAIRPAAEPGKTYFLTFFVSCEADAHRVMAILHAAGQERRDPAVAAEADAVERFYARLRRAPALATNALMGANIAIFALMVLTGAGLVNPELGAVVRWGARYNPLIESGQWWRLLTPMFIHIGLIHLLFNMWALKNLGDFVERLYGPGRFLAIYFGAGLAGSVSSFLIKPDVISAGASGAVFGIMGALVAFIYRRHQVIPRQLVSGLRSSAFSFIGYNLLFGFLVSFIDNWAHLGGLVGGAVLGWALAPAARPQDDEDAPEPTRAAIIRWRIYAAILAAVLTGLIVLGREVTKVIP